MEHSRIAQLRSRIRSLPLDERSRTVLLHSIDYFGEQIVVRSHRPRQQRPSDLEALPGATLGGMTERALQEKYSA